ncbi:chloramphenicol acetyltransferase-like domain-containing protein [Tanacetum coccineum]
MVSNKRIAHQFAKDIINDLFIPYIKMKDAIRQNFMIDVSLGQCKRAKQRALCDHEGWNVEDTKWLGVITAMGKDANNQMYPIAWAVVRVENTDNWCWFLALLHDDLKLQQGTGLTLISDGHKGLHEAVRDWMPNAEHRKCTRHIYANSKEVQWSQL